MYLLFIKTHFKNQQEIFSQYPFKPLILSSEMILKIFLYLLIFTVPKFKENQFV